VFAAVTCVFYTITRVAESTESTGCTALSQTVHAISFQKHGRELKRKFTSRATDVVSADRAEKIWQAVFHLEELKSLSPLMNLLRTGP